MRGWLIVKFLGLLHKFILIGRKRLPELIKIQCFKSASQLYMLD